MEMRVVRRRASFIGAAMPERIECIDDRSLLIANHPHLTAQGEILSGRTKTRTSAIVTEYLTAVGIDWRGS